MEISKEISDKLGNILTVIEQKIASVGNEDPYYNRITIKSCSNGWIIETPAGYESDAHAEVITHNHFGVGETKESCESYRDVLHLVLEYLGYVSSKHHDYVLSIDVKQNEKEYDS
jgi:hypothetical protein